MLNGLKRNGNCSKIFFIIYQSTTLNKEKEMTSIEILDLFEYKHSTGRTDSTSQCRNCHRCPAFL
jgi:hypothetical protein